MAVLLLHVVRGMVFEKILSGHSDSPATTFYVVVNEDGMILQLFHRVYGSCKFDTIHHGQFHRQSAFHKQERDSIEGKIREPMRKNLQAPINTAIRQLTS